MAYCRSLYGAFLVKMARYDEAEGMLLTSRAALDQALGRENDRTQKTYRHLVELYEA